MINAADPRVGMGRRILARQPLYMFESYGLAALLPHSAGVIQQLNRETVQGLFARSVGPPALHVKPLPAFTQAKLGSGHGFLQHDLAAAVSEGDADFFMGAKAV